MILLFLVIPFVSGVCPPGYSDRYVYPYQASGKSLDFFEYQLRRVRFHYVRNFSLYLPEPRKECVQLVHYKSWLYPIVVYVPVSETFVTVAQVLQNIMIDVFTTLGGILTGVFRESVPFMIDTVVSILKVLIDNALFLLDSLKLLEFVVMYPLIYLKFRDNYLTMMILIVCYIIRLLI